MAGRTDLAAMLASLRIERLDEPVTVVTVGQDARPCDAPTDEPLHLGEGVLALIAEAEGTTAVVTVAEARRRGWPVDFVAAWLTVAVHSSLDAVGLTAALSAALAERHIACNVLAGFHHDHLLVPLQRADEAVECLHGLADRQRRPAS